MPGDPRGFKTWRKRRYIPPSPDKSHFGEAMYNPEDFAAEFEHDKQMTAEAVAFSVVERRSVAEAIAQDLENLAVVPSILAVADVHVHLVAKFGGLKIRPAVGRLRSAATQRLHDHGVAQKRIWAKGCHMESLPDEESFRQAFDYVQAHPEQGAVVKIWQLEFADDALPF